MINFNTEKAQEDIELVGTEDLFENDELVLLKATYKPPYEKIVRTAVGIKDKNGDIVKLIQVDEKCYPRTK